MVVVVVVVVVVVIIIIVGVVVVVIVGGPTLNPQSPCILMPRATRDVIMPGLTFWPFLALVA